MVSVRTRKSNNQSQAKWRKSHIRLLETLKICRQKNNKSDFKLDDSIIKYIKQTEKNQIIPKRLFAPKPKSDIEIKKRLDQTLKWYRSQRPKWFGQNSLVKKSRSAGIWNGIVNKVGVPYAKSFINKTIRLTSYRITAHFKNKAGITKNSRMAIEKMREKDVKLFHNLRNKQVLLDEIDEEKKPKFGVERIGKSIFCPVCHFVTEKPYVLRDHVRVHRLKNDNLWHQNKYFRTLKSCGKRREEIGREYAATFSKSGKVYICSKCPFSTSRKFEIWQHFRFHKLKSYINCSQCSFGTSTRFKMQLHMIWHSKWTPEIRHGICITTPDDEWEVEDDPSAPDLSTIPLPIPIPQVKKESSSSRSLRSQTKPSIRYDEHQRNFSDEEEPPILEDARISARRNSENLLDMPKICAPRHQKAQKPKVVLKISKAVPKKRQQTAEKASITKKTSREIPFAQRIRSVKKEVPSEFLQQLLPPNHRVGMPWKYLNVATASEPLTTPTTTTTPHRRPRLPPPPPLPQRVSKRNEQQKMAVLKKEEEKEGEEEEETGCSREKTYTNQMMGLKMKKEAPRVVYKENPSGEGTSKAPDVSWKCWDIRCPFETSSIDKRRTHEERHHGNGTFTCRSCSFRCETDVELKAHSNSHSQRVASSRRAVLPFSYPLLVQGYRQYFDGYYPPFHIPQYPILGMTYPPQQLYLCEPLRNNNQQQSQNAPREE